MGVKPVGAGIFPGSPCLKSERMLTAPTTSRCT
jgi:hypothetical protein